MPSPAVTRAHALAAEGRHRDAFAALAEASGAGDSDALRQLADWRIQGGIVRRDLGEARALLQRAAAAGNDDAALLHAFFAANGVGGPSDWPGALASLRELAPRIAQARAQLDALADFALDEAGGPMTTPQLERLSESPSVAVARGLLGAAECAYLVSRATPMMAPSLVVDPATGRMGPHPIRTCDFASFGVYYEDFVVGAINRRIAALSGTDHAHGEPLQVLRYFPGGEYRPHMDALPATDNQRIVTVLVYLNEDYEGGETHFPELGLRFRGRPGDALMFANVDAEGRADPRARHAGLPVRSGTKLVASRWIRRTRFTYPPPTPILADS